MQKKFVVHARCPSYIMNSPSSITIGVNRSDFLRQYHTQRTNKQTNPETSQTTRKQQRTSSKQETTNNRPQTTIKHTTKKKPPQKEEAANNKQTNTSSYRSLLCDVCFLLFRFGTILALKGLMTRYRLWLVMHPWHYISL